MNLKSILILLIIFMDGKAYSQSWYSVGDNFDNQAVSLFNDSISNKLFIAGNFRKIGNKSAKGVAAWDGLSWDTLNGGMDFQPAKFVIRYANDIYCCGLFRKSNGVNGVTTNGFAKWNGLSWDSINIGFNPGGPYDYTIYNGLLYLVGSFGTVNNNSCSSATIWDGSGFSNIGIPNPSINGGQTCAFFNGKFYIAGVFSDINSTIYHLASWDGIQWQQVSTTVDGYFLSMAVYHNELYLSGWGIIGPGQFIIKYDGVNFTSVGGDLNAQAYKLKVINDKLFAVGVFDFAGGVPCSKIAIWDGSIWNQLSNDTFNNGISDIEVYNNSLYVCGAFTKINNDSISVIARYAYPLTNEEHFISSNANDVQIFPNPSSTEKITIQSSLINNNSSITITDILGNIKISYSTLYMFNNEIDISTLSHGVYIITLKNNKASSVARLIKN